MLTDDTEQSLQNKLRQKIVSLKGEGLGMSQDEKNLKIITDIQCG